MIKFAVENPVKVLVGICFLVIFGGDMLFSDIWCAGVFKYAIPSYTKY